MDFAKTQKTTYFENETLFFLQIKKFLNYTHQRLLYGKKNSFVAEVTFKDIMDLHMPSPGTEGLFYATRCPFTEVLHMTCFFCRYSDLISNVFTF